MKKNLRLVFLSCFLVAGLMINHALAVTAYPKQINYNQPDGTSLTVQMRGDEWIHWAETTDGYTVLSGQNNGYEYAIKDADGNLKLSGILAHNPGQRSQSELALTRHVEKNAFFSNNQLKEMKAFYKGSGNSRAVMSGGFPTTGTRKLLVILANFSNTSTTFPQTNFDNYMNQANYNGTGSFKDYFLEVSYGQLTVMSTVTTWVTLSNTHDYYGPESKWGQFAYDAVVAANNQAAVDFSQYDNNGDGYVDGIAIFHQGEGQEYSGSTNDIWSHSWSLSSAGYSSSQRTFDGVLVDDYTTMPETMGGAMGTIGVMCHEFGHNLGAPDFYDTDYSTSGQYDGTGEWDLQASGSWNGNNGTKPAAPNPYTKAYVYNWVTPTVISTAQNVTLNDATTSTDVVRYNTTTTNEYFLCENRQQTGFNTGIPGHGMLIYHVDGSYITSHSSANDINCTSHQGMYPMSAVATTSTGIHTTANNKIDVSGCPWPGTSSKTTFTDATTPWSKSWAGNATSKPITNIVENTSTGTITFSFMGGSVTPAAPTATTVAAGNISTTTATLNATVNANNASTTVTFEYGTTTSYGSTISGTPGTVTGATATAVTAALTGLTANTTYNFRVVAVNSVGTTYGSNMTFTTTANPTSLTLPVTENFTASSMPTGWTTQNTGTSITERWSISNTANAGGAAYELKCSYQNVNPGTTRVITPAINTIGVSGIALSFKHMFDDYGAGATLKIQSSTDKVTWTDEAWSLASTSNSNIGPATVSTTVANNLNSATTYVAFVVTGNLYQIDYWYIDNVSLTSGAATTVPTVTTAAVSNITSSSATGGGNVTSDGGATVTERGICYATTQNPTTSNTIVTSGTGTGAFTASMTGLSASTTYYVRAYAINSNGTAYGSQVSFTTSAGGGTTTDVTVGTGTSTQGFPLNCYYGYERSAALYTASEIGITGSISKLSWYPTKTTTYNVPVKIYIKQTTSTTITSSTWATAISGATLVYSGTMAGTTAGSWKEFALSTAFSFTGGSNNLLVLVETNYGGSGTGTSTGPAIRYTSASKKHMYVRADNSAPTGKGTVNNNRPNLKLTITTSSKSFDIDINTTANTYNYELKVYPNPVKDKVTVEYSGEIKSIELYTITGTKVYSQTVVSNNASAEVDFSKLPAGTYIIVVNDGIKPRTAKVIKQ
ncbi:MAG TPA: M6 family metalloprotease domain-containing protein [Bacteroidales bacterium]|nr:M6 family metalloprotease domain-containing protein [Bacteroidales bacterium]